MGFSNTMTDGAALAEFGHRIARLRIDNEMTQAQLADAAGIAKRTVEHIEAGDSVQLTSLVRVMRVLGLLEALELILPPLTPRPMDYIARKGAVRRRVSHPRVREEPGPSWSWGDQS